MATSLQLHLLSHFHFILRLTSSPRLPTLGVQVTESHWPGAGGCVTSCDGLGCVCSEPGAGASLALSWGAGASNHCLCGDLQVRISRYSQTGGIHYTGTGLNDPFV